MLPKPRSYDFETLTPIWTGNAHGQAGERLIESSFLGGLRWWAECLARGVGCGEVGTPSQAAHDPKAGHNSLDPVSKIFGATSWRRRFRFEIDDSAMLPSTFPPQHIEVHTGTPNDPKGKGMSRWYNKSASRKGVFSLSILPEKDCNPGIIEGLLGFITRRAGFGARTQMGFGIVRANSGAVLQSEPLIVWLRGLPKSKGPDIPLPSIDTLFFAEVHVPTLGYEHTFRLKANLRAKFRDNAAIRHFLFGKVIGNTREGSKISISLPYGNPPVVRLWGWVPDAFNDLQDQPIQFKRNAALNRIYTVLSASGSLLAWRAMSDPRDTVRTTADPIEFVQSLVQS